MLFGGALLGLAVYFYTDTLQYIESSARTWPIYSTFFLAIFGIGIFTLIVGFFGCCGASKESSCMLCLYFTIIIAICSIIATIVFLPDKFGEIKPEKIRSGLQQDIKEIIQKSYSRYNTTSFPNMLIDKIQEDFQCCGASNYTDWYYSLQNNVSTIRPDIGVGPNSVFYITATPQQTTRQLAPQSQQQTYYNRANQQQHQQNHQIQSSPITAAFRVPASCCSTYNENSYNQCKSLVARYDASSGETRIPNVNPDGCVDKIYHYLFVVNWWPLNIIGGLAIGLQGLSLIFSLCLCCAINRAIDDDYDDEGK